MKTLVGIVTFGNVEFTKLTLNSIRGTTRSPIDFFVVVGKPDDDPTREWLEANQWVTHLVEPHGKNRGFPACINDIYDWGWNHNTYDNVIIAGNDIVPYPGAIDALIEQAETTDFEWIASSMFDVQSLLRMYPEQARFFEGPNFKFEDFTQRPWAVHESVVAATAQGIESNPEGPSLIKDVRNLCLFKRSVFEKLGYADVNFWPGGYFEDNDYARRAVNAGIKSCALTHSQYFHFWSRTLNQEIGQSGSQETRTARDVCFQRNEKFYRTKWGGPFAREEFGVPFGGGNYVLAPDVILPGTIKIPSRENDAAIVDYWAARTG
jgi:GT2 family glycosyltransferase